MKNSGSDTTHPTKRDGPIHVVVSLELFLQRESISRALAQLRPEWRVCHFAPDELDRTLEQHQPDVIICAPMSERAGLQIPMWILLNPPGSDSSVVLVDGRRSTVSDLAISSVVDVIERTSH